MARLSAQVTQNAFHELARRTPGARATRNGLTLEVPAYLVYQYRGRRPGAKQPPQAPIERWMRRVGIRDVSPYVIARAIGRDGIPPNRRPLQEYVLAQLTGRGRINV